MNLSSISCIVPAYNAEKFIAPALESILAQTHPPVEVIVIDDGSTDATPELVRAFGDPVRYVIQPGRGLPSARNYGVELARSDLIASLDADDLWHPDKLMQQVAFLQAHSEVDLCLTMMQNIWIEALVEEAEQLRDSRRARPMPGFIFSTILASKATFERVGPCDLTRRHAHVADWFLRAERLGLKIEVLPDVLMWHRNHFDNMTRREQDISRSEFLSLVRDHLNHRRGNDRDRS